MAENPPIKAEVIRDLPERAIYVIPINFKTLRLAVTKAAELGRLDVTFVTPLFLEPDALKMVPGRPVVVDDDAYLEPEQKQALEWYRGNAAN